MNNADISTHKRINETFLTPFERPALRWLAARMPAWVTPDLLTGFGVLGAVIIAGSFIMTNISPAFLWLASIGVIMNWFGDSLDGTLARFRKIERPAYGFFIDHIVDTFDEIIVFIGLGLSPYVKFDIAMMALVAYLAMEVYVFLYTYVKGVFKISFARIGPTEVRAIMIIANALIFFLGNPTIQIQGAAVELYTIIVGLVAVVLFGAFIVLSLTSAAALSREDERRLTLKLTKKQEKAEKARVRAAEREVRRETKRRGKNKQPGSGTVEQII